MKNLKIKKGQDLYKKAKKLIPGGNMLLSKRPEMFLPDFWPCYFSKSKGCVVWDLDKNKYIDMSIMGIGTNILGYGHSEVDKAVLRTVQDGNMSTLNCPEEVFLAEKLIELHPWAEMVRYARTGGEANAIAIRIARAATGRDKVAICGYHGWHDWYLATNLQDSKGLEEHLLTGLEPNGVPRNLKGSVYPFSVNNIEQLRKIVSENKLAAVKMEVQRSIPPYPGFLEEVKSLCSKNGIVLIFDECTSGFRENLGGKHLKFKVNPDLAMFGKAIGNGYAINAIIGKRKYMKNAEKTFISSTFWTERVGSVAALSTIKYMEKNKTFKKIIAQGKKIKNKWKELSIKYKIDLDIISMDSIPIFLFKTNHEIKKKFIINEMLKEGILASNIIYVSISHTDEILKYYFRKLDKIFHKLSIISKQNLEKEANKSLLLSHFKRMN